MRLEDIHAHEMHIGFSAEEQKRIFDSKHKLFINKFPLVDMGLTRKDNYKYSLETRGLDTKGSACLFCLFHTNYFFMECKENYNEDYKKLLQFDSMLELKQPYTPIKSKIYISRSRKRIMELTAEECNDMETFEYNGQKVWNGF